MSHPLESLMAEAVARAERAERKIAEAQLERNKARIEIAAFERAILALGLTANAGKMPETAATAPQEKRVRAAKSVAPQLAWVPVFQALHARQADGFGYDEIAAVADRLGVDYKRASLRTKMMNYVNAGVMKRVDNGRFRLTDQGKSMFQIDASPNENGEALASPDDDEVAASSLF